MKKQFLLLAGSAIILASCGSNENKEGQTQAQIDSTVNAEVAKRDAENAAKNDSMLRAAEKEKADALEQQRAGSKTTKTTKVKTETKVTETPPPAPAPTPGGMKGHSDQTQQNPAPGEKKAGGGMRSHSDQNQK